MVGVADPGIRVHHWPSGIQFASPVEDLRAIRFVSDREGAARFPERFWIFAWFALFYGVCETMNGNWASLYMTKALGANATLAALALTVFWGAVTVGRILFAAIEKWFPERRACTSLPFVVVAGFAATAVLPKTRPELGIASFALSGLGCSALLPLSISFGQKQLTAMASPVAGSLIAFIKSVTA